MVGTPKLRGGRPDGFCPDAVRSAVAPYQSPISIYGMAFTLSLALADTLALT